MSTTPRRARAATPTFSLRKRSTKKSKSPSKNRKVRKTHARSRSPSPNPPQLSLTLSLDKSSSSSPISSSSGSFSSLPSLNPLPLSNPSSSPSSSYKKKPKAISHSQKLKPRHIKTKTVIYNAEASSPRSVTVTTTTKRKKHKKSKTVRSATPTLNHSHKFDDFNNDTPLLKRLKSENKELRKSRNTLRKKADILGKIEHKLRHKLDIILRKFKSIAIDISSDVDWNRLQKSGDIDGVLEALLTQFGRITDAYMKNQQVWKVQDTNWQLLQSEWYKFNGQEVEEEFDVSHMFVQLREQWKEMEEDKRNKLKECNLLIVKDRERRVAQQASVNAMEQEVLEWKSKMQALKASGEEMQEKFLLMQKQLQKVKDESEQEKIKMQDTMSDNNRVVQRAQLEKQKLSDTLDAKNELIESLQAQIADLQSNNSTLTDDMNQLKVQRAELKSTNSDLQEKNERLLVKEQELDELKKYHVILLQTQQRLGEELKGKEGDIKTLDLEIEELKKKCKCLDGMKIEYAAIQKRYKDTKEAMDKFKSDWEETTLVKNELEKENEELKSATHAMKEVMGKLEKENAEMKEKLSADMRTSGTQTDFTFIMEDAHMQALQKDNDYLIKELNFLIAERSRFKECESEVDFHQGDISCMTVSPVNYSVCTAGKQDNSVRIWQPEDSLAPEITFVPKQKAIVDGTIYSLNVSSDGQLMAAGCSLKNTVNGYVVIWNLKDNGNVLCNLRSRYIQRFGRVHCVEFMKFNENKKKTSKKKKAKNGKKVVKKNRNKNKKGGSKNKEGTTGFTYLLFGGDTTGCILCWNLNSEKHCQVPVSVINGHTDIIYDLSIVDDKWLFTVSHDQQLMYCDISSFDQKELVVENGRVSPTDYVFAKKLYKDDSKYPLKAVTYNRFSNELVFGSRKCNVFSMNAEYEEQKNEEETTKYFKSKKCLNTKDLDHIMNLRMRDHLMVVQRIGVNYVKLFNVESNKLVKTYQIDDGMEQSQNKFRIYDCGITFDRKFAVLCVGVLNKENSNNLSMNRSALKGFKIPKSANK